MTKATMAIVMLTGALTLAAGGARAGDFWPLTVGLHATYTDGTEILVEARAQANSATYHQSGAGVDCRNSFVAGAGGDIYAVGGTGTGFGGSCAWSSPTPILFLDLPLYPTKTWSGVYGGRVVRGRVETATSAQLTDGVLFCYIVTIQGLSPCLDGTWWVNDTYGPARLPRGGTLTVTPVAAATPTWGALKAQYR